MIAWTIKPTRHVVTYKESNWNTSCGLSSFKIVEHNKEKTPIGENLI
jgi:hypothetical protein